MRHLSGAGLVFLGGAIGTLARFLLDGAIGGANGIRIGLFVINVLGAFLLGLLVQSLAPDGGDRWRSTRLFLGTGMLGGFTTYSALSVSIAALMLEGRLGTAVAYGLATLVLGAVASAAGVLAGQARQGKEAGG